MVGDSILLGCDTVSLGECFRTFWWIVLSSSPGVNHPRLYKSWSFCGDRIHYNFLGQTTMSRSEGFLMFQGLTPSPSSGCCWWWKWRCGCLPEKISLSDYLPMKMNSLWTSEMSGTTDQITQHHIAEDINVYCMVHLNTEIVPSVTQFVMKQEDVLPCAWICYGCFACTWIMNKVVARCLLSIVYWELLFWHKACGA